MCPLSRFRLASLVLLDLNPLSVYCSGVSSVKLCLVVDSNAATLVAYKDNHLNTSKIFRCSSQDPAPITFKHSHLWNKMKSITINQYNGNSFSAKSCFYGGIVSGHSRDTVSPRVTVAVDSQSSYSWFSDLVPILRAPHQFICEISTPIPAVILAL